MSTAVRDLEQSGAVVAVDVGGTTVKGMLRIGDVVLDRAVVPTFGPMLALLQKAGGNLAEALGNLSRVLRERKKMKGKIKAMAMEAKASAYIIGSLPGVVMGLVWITSPQYISLLFTDSIGHIILVCSVIWMGMGIMIMRKMINFKH